jgi:molybdopterin molybdotransferase
MSDPRRSGFKQRTQLSTARERLLDVDTIERTERVPLSAADGRVVSTPLDAGCDVPHYPRAAMDGWAVRAADTFDAADRSPAVLRRADAVGPDTATLVHTGSELPDGADAVVKVEATEVLGEELEVFDAVAEGENVAPIGEDVADGQRLYDAGEQLRPSDLGLLKATGADVVEAVAVPEVAVIPTGEELVPADPGPGEVIETNRFTVSRLAERWGADVTRRDIVTDDAEALRVAIERDLTRDVVVTTGGSSVGDRDLVPAVVDDIGEVFVHGVALKPGHPVALGRVQGVSVVMLPGYPVAAIVNAVQFLRPLLKHLGGMPAHPPPTSQATLSRKIRSDPGVRTFVRVELAAGPNGGTGVSGGEVLAPRGGTDHDLEATPTRASGAGVLSSVALADGWVVVPDRREGIPEGETVTVEHWEYHG